MSWYRDTFTDRQPISCPPDATTPKDQRVTLGYDDSELWAFVLPSGDDLLVTSADGVTLVPRVLTGFNTTTRAGSIDLDGVVTVANVTNILWMYHGNTAAAAPTPGAAVASPATAYLDKTLPGRTVLAAPQRFGDTRPRDVIVKSVAEQFYLYVDFTDWLSRRRYANESRDLYEEPATVTYTVNLAGAPQATMFDTSLTRWVEANGRRYAKVFVKAGTTATTYTLVVTVTTSLSQTLVSYSRVAVRDTSET